MRRRERPWALRRSLSGLIRLCAADVSLDLCDEFPGYEGFYEQGLCAGFARFRAGFHVLRRSYADHRDVFCRGIGLQLSAHLVSVHHGHHDVQQDGVRLVRLRDVHRSDSVVRADNFKSFGTKGAFQKSNDLRFIVDHEYFRFSRHVYERPWV